MFECDLFMIISQQYIGTVMMIHYLYAYVPQKVQKRYILSFVASGIVLYSNRASFGIKVANASLLVVLEGVHKQMREKRKFDREGR